MKRASLTLQPRQFISISVLLTYLIQNDTLGSENYWFHWLNYFVQDILLTLHLPCNINSFNLRQFIKISILLTCLIQYDIFGNENSGFRLVKYFGSVSVSCKLLTHPSLELGLAVTLTLTLWRGGWVVYNPASGKLLTQKRNSPKLPI